MPIFISGSSGRDQRVLRLDSDALDSSYLFLARPLLGKMTTSKRLADRKVAKFQKNITKRGSVPETTVKKGNDYPVGPILLGFFVFVVIGSCKFFLLKLPFTLGYSGNMNVFSK
ncbi:hypothetical protein Taro_027455 [Colocasia esculenta]|uniref:Stress-associated endoplasmic reticulum protein n=1 Tax=Colocasia esculenta TaxID=4460 RepID=A0A843VMI8_COLES|nr:hypothetical protein [Colocasia esculenta]